MSPLDRLKLEWQELDDKKDQDEKFWFWTEVQSSCPSVSFPDSRCVSAGSAKIPKSRKPKAKNESIPKCTWSASGKLPVDNDHYNKKHRIDVHKQNIKNQAL